MLSGFTKVNNELSVFSHDSSPSGPMPTSSLLDMLFTCTNFLPSLYLPFPSVFSSTNPNKLLDLVFLTLRADGDSYLLLFNCIEIVTISTATPVPIQEKHHW